MTLRFIDFIASEPQDPSKADKFRRADSICSVFLKIDRIHLFDVGCSKFDVGRSSFFKLLNPEPGT
jgi:hypothetical protein